MSVKKLSYYLQDADITLRSDHLPLKKFLSKNTLNTKVNNWAIEISPYRIQFEYIKGIKNTLADTMSRLIKITPEIELEPEPTGQEYGYEVFEELQPIETTTCHVDELKEELQKKKDPIPEDIQPIIDLTEEQLEDIQMKDKFIKNQINRIISGKQFSGKPYYLEGRLLKKYIYDNKQRFEVTVVPPNCAAMLLNLAHDQMGHNGSARTYMLLKKLYYWKGMKTDINIYVKQCKLCQRQNIVPVKYSQGHFSAPMAPMEFISMDLIGDFIPSSKGNKYALTVICMLTGYTFCIPIPSKKASDVVTAYVDNVYAKFGGSKKILSDNGTEFKNQLFEKVAKELGVEFKVKLQDANITEIDKARFRSLCNEFEDIFSKSSEDIGHTPLVTMDIDTGDSPPVCQKPYSLPLKHVEWVQKEIEILERAGVIQRSMSAWASPIVIVPKKTEPGELPRRRMCVDYRMLNSLLPLVNKAHSKAKGIVTLVPLPKIDEIYAQLQGSKIFSALDMRSGYFHIELSEDAKPKTAFVPGGPHGSKYQFNRCPFGLSQAPAYFQRLVHEVLKGLPFTFGYLDDILIFSSGVEAHLEHLRKVFLRLREAKLKLKASKCSFFKKHIQYLGHLVSGNGIEPLPEKLEAVENIPPPKTPKEVRQFLGLVGYYRKFVPKFADIARPLTNLTKQDIKFEWSEKNVRRLFSY